MKLKQLKRDFDTGTHYSTGTQAKAVFQDILTCQSSEKQVSAHAAQLVI